MVDPKHKNSHDYTGAKPHSFFFNFQNVSSKEKIVIVKLNV